MGPWESTSREGIVPILGCSIGDATGRTVVHRVVRQEGAELSLLPSPLGRHDACLLERCAAFIFDMAPWDASVAQLMEWLRESYPILPILLYTPHVPGAAELVLRCGSMHGVSAVSQFHQPTNTSELRRAIRDLLNCIDGLLFLQLIERVEPGIRNEVARFARFATQMLNTERSVTSLTVTQIAMRMRCSPRSLNRSWAQTSLPQPKEFLDWLLLLFVSFKALRSGVSMSKVARSVGLDSQRSYRIRKRLLSGVAELRISSPGQVFDVALLAFLERCGVQGSRAMNIRRQLIG